MLSEFRPSASGRPETGRTLFTARAGTGQALEALPIVQSQLFDLLIGVLVGVGDAVIVDVLAAALIERGLSAERPVMILSANAIDHALLMLAGYTAGVPVAPVSVAYSLQSQDFAKLLPLGVRQGADGNPVFSVTSLACV